jgi:GH35 family endo-1,4-beta-xylanase
MKKIISFLLACLFVLGIVPITEVTVASTANPAWDMELDSIHERYRNHFKFGNILNPGSTTNIGTVGHTSGTADFYKRHFNVITLENAMKPGPMSNDTHVDPRNGGRWNLSAANDVLDFAKANGIEVVGHTLLWHRMSPRWVNHDQAGNNWVVTNRATAKANMEYFIKTVAGYFEENYKGVVTEWDVVNEAFINIGEGFSIRNNWRDALRSAPNNRGNASELAPWYDAYANGANAAAGECGSDYIYDAFVFARLYAPSARLVYNDYNEEWPNKRDAIAQMTEELNAQWAKDPRNTEPGRLLIEVLGMQSHFWGGWGRDANGNLIAGSATYNPSRAEATIKRWAQTGVRISITELDIPMGGHRQDDQFRNPRWNNPLSPELEELQAKMYANLMRVYINNAEHIDRVSLWGIYDGQSWHRGGMPLLFNNSLQPKMAYHAIMDPFNARYNFTSSDIFWNSTGSYRNAVPPPNWPPVSTPTDPLNSANDWARADIVRSIDLGLLPNNLQGSYTQPTTRAEFCALAVGLYEKVIGRVITERLTFNDTNDVNVQKMGALRVVNGVGGDNFNPTGTISRQEAATILARLAVAVDRPLAPHTATFSDMGSVADFAREPVGQMQQSRIMRGDGDSFNPGGTYTRQESIVTLLRLYDYEP